MPRGIAVVLVSLAIGLIVPAAPIGAQVPAQLVYVLGAEPVTLDPPNQTDNPSETVVRHVYDNLVTFDERLQIIPALAERWEVSSDHLTWTFYLRRGVRFHDGSEFNAQAVKVNLDRVTTPAKPTRRTSLYQPFIKSAEVVDPYTIRIVTPKPFGALLAHLAHGAGGIVSPVALRRYGDKIGLNPVGTGPFRFVEWIPGDRIVLARNERFWGPKPAAERLVFRFVREDASRVVMLESGEADVAVNVPALEVDRLTKNRRLVLIRRPSNRIIYIGFNVTVRPFNDVRVRKALNHAVDKSAIVNTILRGFGKVADSPLAPGNWGYAKAGAYPYDVGKARALLREAGVAEGTTVRLWSPEGRYFMDRAAAEAVQGYLSAVGLRVEFRRWEWGAYLRTLDRGPREGGYELFLLGWAPSTGDADWGLRPLFMCTMLPPAGNNNTGYCNPKVDDLLQQGMSTADPAARAAVYRQVQQVIFDDAPWIFLHTMYQLVGIKRGLAGIQVLPIEIILVREAKWPGT
ncbi:MAG: glutathione ABC transporter substrate-binding protein [Armatimonadota bacterium]|nr:glutathione ABC transporter substrate-binding protein [Armatimonadota bacterium]MDR7464775.1 glutathione ABC transporter substrate-binding protein [Armatimonadota bacterium]MDR7475303.1 glutathione ABC transporter substrate-binding protein [Armatimonadota bacterium]MDR7539964.1 glutathione ABC transporter substrate-binding protein [Armatimonadota bacterium]